MTGKNKLFTPARTVGFIAGASLAVVPMTTFAQRTVTDASGTEYLVDALPTDVQAQVFETQSALEMGTAGPLQVDQSGRYFLDPAASTGKSQELLVDQLIGIVIVPRPGDVRADGWPGVQGIWHDFDEFPQEAGASLAGYLGQPVSLASLDQMVREAIRAYREAGRPVVDILLPEQDITSGVVQLVVVEGELDRIRIEGASPETEEYLRRQITLNQGDTIRSAQVQTDLNWINRSPYRKVDLVYAPGYEFGATDIILKTYESDPFWFYTGYENSGTELLGDDRFLFGFNWGDAFGPDQSISYQLTTDFELDTVRGHSLVYQGPTPWHHWLTLLGSYVDVNAEIPTGDDVLVTSGSNLQFSGRYAVPLNFKGNATHEAEFGFDYKSSNNDLEFGGQEVFDTTTEIYQFSLGYDWTRQDRLGLTRADATGYWSPGSMSPQNTDAIFDSARAGSSSDYLYARLGIERQNALPEGWSLRAKAEAQVSNGNLQASEQLGAGGYDTVRGFEQRIARGDEGFRSLLEIYTPATSIGRMAKWENETDELRFLGFYDAAMLSNVDRLPDEPNQIELQSVGLGLRYRYSDFFRLRLDYGVPVSSKNVDNGNENGRWHIGATANF